MIVTWPTLCPSASYGFTSTWSPIYTISFIRFTSQRNEFTSDVLLRIDSCRIITAWYSSKGIFNVIHWNFSEHMFIRSFERLSFLFCKTWWTWHIFVLRLFDVIVNIIFFVLLWSKLSCCSHSSCFINFFCSSCTLESTTTIHVWVVLSQVLEIFFI